MSAPHEHLVVLVGTIGFKTLPGLYTGPELSWLDALFHAGSAFCNAGFSTFSDSLMGLMLPSCSSSS